MSYPFHAPKPHSDFRITTMNASMRRKLNTALATNPATNGNLRAGNTINNALWHLDAAIVEASGGVLCLDQQTADSFIPPKASRQLGVISVYSNALIGWVHFSYERGVTTDDSLEVVAYYAGNA